MPLLVLGPETPINCIVTLVSAYVVAIGAVISSVTQECVVSLYQLYKHLHVVWLPAAVCYESTCLLLEV